jgi:hypothetical protein
MDPFFGDVSSFCWIDHESIGFPGSHVQALELFRDSVVLPSLNALDTEIQRLHQSEDPTAIFIADDYTELFQTTVEGYLIAVQSMWERGLRALLIERERKTSQSPKTIEIERATWSGRRAPTLQDHFRHLMGISIQAFDSFQDLDLLQSLGSAIRHGDGDAAKRVHQISPNLWFNWLEPGGEIIAGPFRMTVPSNTQKHPPFESITLPQALLEQMIQSVLWFWEDLERMRCNSFKRKHHSVVAKLSTWRADRSARQSSRKWHPTDGAFPRSAA